MEQKITENNIENSQTNEVEKQKNIDNINQTNNKKAQIIQVLKFFLFSISAGAIQMGSFTLLNELMTLSYWPAYLISLLLSVVWNFTFNRKFTFKSANNVPIAMLLVLAYYAVFTPLSTLWGDALEKAGWNEYIILIGTMLINFITEFLYQKFVVFREKKQKNKLNNN